MPVSPWGAVLILQHLETMKRKSAENRAKLFSFLGKRRREIRKCENRRRGIMKLAIGVGAGLALLWWRVQADALPPRGNVGTSATPKSAEAAQTVQHSLRRFSRGQVLYLQHCADCHGWEGRGDGPLAGVLANRPPILRQEIGIFAHNSDTPIVERILAGVPFRTIQFGTAPYTDEELSSLVSYLQQVPTIRWQTVQQGKEVYDSLCAACHGLYGRGDGLGARSFAARLPDLSNPTYQQQHPEASLIHSITNGTGEMSGAGDILTAPDIRAVVAFLRVLSPGYELYSRFCAYCHGADGVPVATKGVQMSPAASNPPPHFDEPYFRTRSVDQIRTSVLHMRRQPRPTMPHLARQLTADDAFEIVRYLRSLATIH
ncbi:MAG: c-type cytochrome [Deltaproteobacteria bacterium]|nr:c-type cytochrome [Deltaproteobacteria bacterium]